MARATGGVRTLLDWMLRHEPQRLDTWFSVSELFWLGWPDGEAAGRAGLRGWGAPAWPVTGCLCLDMPPARSWDHWIGVPGSGIRPTLTPDSACGWRPGWVRAACPRPSPATCCR